MLKNTELLKGITVKATDGELGVVDEFYFDDESWAIRYLVLETGNWLAGREVLISPYSIVRMNWETRHLELSLTMEQVKNSPNLNTHEPVSRQHEASYLGYYGYPNYWGGKALWGESAHPFGMVGEPINSTSLDATRLRVQSEDSHLRSSDAVKGYHLQAIDGEVGHVDSFVVDDEAWAIRYVDIATRNWLPGKHVLVSPEWITTVSWINSKLYSSLTVEAIRSAPEYEEDRLLTREEEGVLFDYYGRPPYWKEPVDHALHV